MITTIITARPRFLLQRQDARDTDGSHEQLVRIPPTVVHTVPHVPGKCNPARSSVFIQPLSSEQPFLSLWRILRGKIRPLPDPPYSREEPRG